MSDQPYFTYNKDGSLSSAVGFDAIECFRVATLMTAIKCAKGGMVLTRGMTMKRCLEMTTQYTGRKYKRTEHEAAVANLKVWLECMKSTIPTETNDH